MQTHIHIVLNWVLETSFWTQATRLLFIILHITLQLTLPQYHPFVGSWEKKVPPRPEFPFLANPETIFNALKLAWFQPSVEKNTSLPGWAIMAFIRLFWIATHRRKQLPYLQGYKLPSPVDVSNYPSIQIPRFQSVHLVLVEPKYWNLCCPGHRLLGRVFLLRKKNIALEWSPNGNLVGGFNPSEKISVKMGIFPK